MREIDDREFALLRDYLHSVCGIEVGEDKRYLFNTRLDALLRRLGCGNFSDFYARLRGDDGATQQDLVEAMTINETSFFRDEHPFLALQREIIPHLATRRSAEATFLPPRLRIWCVGCSTGEEAYSVAMCARAWLDGQSLFGPRDVSVLGVDISARAIRMARQASYESQVLEQVPSLYRRFFVERGRQAIVCDEVRAMVAFAQLNLAESFEHLGTFDLILCRNVMIYFSAPLKRRIVDDFFEMLSGEGVLLLGASEGLYMLSDRFQARSCGKTSYYCAANQRRGRTACGEEES